MALDGITIKLLSQEIGEKITGGQILKIVQPDPLTLAFTIRNKGAEFSLVYSETAPFPSVYLSPQPIGRSSENPPALCMLLRKYLIGARIGEVQQEGWDRVLTILLDQKKGSGLTSYRLYFELTGRFTNFIIVDENQKIIDALHRVSGKATIYREILPNVEYIPPPPLRKYPPIEYDPERLANTFFLYEKESTLQKAFLNQFSGLSPAFISDFLETERYDSQLLISQMEPEKLMDLLRLLQEKVDSILKEPRIFYWQNSKSQKYSLTLFQNSHENVTEAADVSTAIQALKVFAGTSETGKKRELLQMIQREMIRLNKRENLLNEDQKKWEKASPYQLWGDLLMIHLNEVPRWEKEIQLVNIFDENQSIIHIPLHYEKSAIENAQAYYALQKKSERAITKIQEQKTSIKEDLTYLDSLLYHLTFLNSYEEMEDFKSELLQMGLIRRTSSKKKKQESAKSKTTPWTFASPSGYTVWVGKNNLQNDTLTFKQSDPFSLWFHAKDIPGSHVLLKVPKNLAPDDMIDDIQYAAELAASYSKGKNDVMIPVDYTLRKNVWKPSGAKPGFVLYDSQKTIYIRNKEKQENP